VVIITPHSFNLVEKITIMDKLTYWQRAKVVFQYIMPQLYLTQFAGWFAQQKWVQ